MKRRGFLGMASAAGVAGAAEVVDPAERALATSPPVLMAPREDGVEVVWSVAGPSLGRVEWEGKEGSGEASADCFGMTAQDDEVVRVRISGLKPGASYRLRAITESAGRERREVSEWKSFRTLDSRAAATRFAIWNDTHEHDATIRKLDEKTPREGMDFLLWNGDVCNDWHRETDLAKVLLSPGGRDITDGRPLLPVWGNHDVRGAWAYRMPEFVATPEGRPYYAFRSGPVAAVCLHTGEDKPDAHPSFSGRVAFEAFRREQADWLRSVIRGPEFRDAPYRVVFCHIPLRWKEERALSQSDYETGSYDAFSRFSREAWHEVLVAWGAQVVVSGHTHRVAWIPASEGFPYAQLTGGGPQEERATWIEGQADSASLTLTVRSLTGEALEAVSFAPRVS